MIIHASDSINERFKSLGLVTEDNQGPFDWHFVQKDAATTEIILSVPIETSADIRTNILDILKRIEDSILDSPKVRQHVAYWKLRDIERQALIDDLLKYKHHFEVEKELRNSK